MAQERVVFAVRTNRDFLVRFQEVAEKTGCTRKATFYKAVRLLEDDLKRNGPERP